MARVLSGPRLLVVTNAARSYDPQDTPEDVEAENEETPAVHRGGGLKRELVGFSKASRLNLAKQLAQISTPELAHHVTLTYGSEFPQTRSDIKSDLQNIQQACLRFGFWGIWRLEFQQRGAAHYHLLVYSSEDMAERRIRLFDAWWHRFTRNPAPAAFMATPGDEAKAAWYMALHQMKMNQSPPIPVGRWWGYINRAEFKRNQVLEERGRSVMEREIIWLKRLMRRKSKTRGSLGTQGFTWFLPEIQHRRVLDFVRDIYRSESGLEVPF